MTQDKPPINTTYSESGEPLVTCGTDRDLITVRRSEGILFVTASEEALGPTVVAAAKHAFDIGMISGDEAVLIDLIEFRAAVDWGAVHKVREMNIWGDVARPIALVVRDNSFASLATLIGTLFPRSTLRLFTDRQAGVSWLKEQIGR